MSDKLMALLESQRRWPTMAELGDLRYGATQVLTQNKELQDALASWKGRWSDEVTTNSALLGLLSDVRTRHYATQGEHCPTCDVVAPCPTFSAVSTPMPDEPAGHDYTKLLKDIMHSHRFESATASADICTFDILSRLKPGDSHSHG